MWEMTKKCDANDFQAIRCFDPAVEASDQVREDVELSVHRDRGSLRAEPQPWGGDQQEK